MPLYVLHDATTAPSTSGQAPLAVAFAPDHVEPARIRADVHRAVLTFDVHLTAVLSPNAREHWAARYKVAQQLKADSKLLAMLATSPSARSSWPLNPPVYVHATVDTQREHDGDNLAAMLKYVCDGLQAAHVVANDRDLVHLPVRQLVDGSGPPGARARIRVFAVTG